MLTAISWDVWATAVIAAVGVILAAVFDQSPLLAIILISLALCVYIAIRTGSMWKMRLVSETSWINENPKVPATRAIHVLT
jgi:hypothetical protein